MEARPTLHTKSITVQLQSLIVDSLQFLSPLPRRSYLVILDECHDKATQQSILQLLCKMSTDYKLRFLIGSHPESHMRFGWTTNLYMQSPCVSSSTKILIPELGCFYKTGLRRSVPRIPSCLTWNNHSPGMALLILCNDHLVNSSMRRLSLNSSVPISAVRRNSLRLY
jgi:hypothetical protein